MRKERRTNINPVQHIRRHPVDGRAIAQQARAHRSALEQDPVLRDMKAHMERPIPTGLDLLHQWTGAPWLKTVADVIRPTAIDQVDVVSPMAVAGELGTVGRKTLQELLAQARYLSHTPTARTNVSLVRDFSREFTDLVRRSFSPRVYTALPDEIFRGSPARTDKYTDAVEATLTALDDMPAGAWRDLPYIRIAPVEPARVHGGVYAVGSGIDILPGSVASRHRIPQVVAHEVGHHVFNTVAQQDPIKYRAILDYLENVHQWDIAANLRGRMAYPQTYGDLRQMHRVFGEQFGSGWPVRPPVSRDMLKEWGTYFSKHPLEDLAETASYAWLKNMPAPTPIHKRAIRALDQDPRREMVNFLTSLGRY